MAMIEDVYRTVRSSSVSQKSLVWDVVNHEAGIEVGCVRRVSPVACRLVGLQSVQDRKASSD